MVLQKTGYEVCGYSWEQGTASFVLIRIHSVVLFADIWNRSPTLVIIGASWTRELISSPLGRGLCHPPHSPILGLLHAALELS